MTDEPQPNLIPPSLEPEPPPEPQLEPPVMAPPPPPERVPFWGYRDLLLFVGLAFVGILLGSMVWGLISLLHLHPLPAAVSVAQMSVIYVFLFAALALVFRVQYDRPFWPSLNWFRSRVPFSFIVLAGIFTAVLVAWVSAHVIHTPEGPNPMTEMMEDRASLLLMAAFGVAVAPLAEELIFRGFLQPLLTRTFGAVLGIIGAAVPFGVLHFHEYGNSWRHAVVLSLAGVGFGVMRHLTGSTRASTGMHASYNAFLFFALFAQRKDWPHLW
jgi:membrane protease YdiL (CAAX protease family)